MTASLTVYGSNWCGYTIRALGFLDELGVEYDYVDVDKHPEEEKRIAEWNNGRSIRPTFDVNGDIFINPPLDTLEAELQKPGAGGGVVVLVRSLPPLEGWADK